MWDLATMKRLNDEQVKKETEVRLKNNVAFSSTERAGSNPYSNGEQDGESQSVLPSAAFKGGNMMGSAFDTMIDIQEENRLKSVRIKYLEGEIRKLGKFVLDMDLGFPSMDEVKYPLGMTPVDSAIEYIHHVQKTVLCLAERVYKKDISTNDLHETLKVVLKADYIPKLFPESKSCPQSKANEEEIPADDNLFPVRGRQYDNVLFFPVDTAKKM
jgi:hypothetical protein